MIDLEKVRQAEIDFGLGNTDGHEVLMLVGPMADEIRRLRGAIQSVEAICAELADNIGGWDAEIAARFRSAIPAGVVDKS
jgi:hypothetical protein